MPGKQPKGDDPWSGKETKSYRIKKLDITAG